jgi:cation diffusion facilitator CzcD-associated flavoprotein CzcO
MTTVNNMAQQPTLEQAIAGLEPVIALLSLVHLTGDRSLLHKYGPKLDGTQQQLREAFVAVDGEIGHREADPAVVAEISEQLLLRMRRDPKPVLTRVDPALFREMARLALAFDMPEHSLEPAYQHAGFTTDTRVRVPKLTPPANFKALVVGAGMMGINAAVKLQQSGIDFTVLEAMHEVGGTWLVSTYPGAAVDTPSILYSYSFDPNPSWTKHYPNGPEFLTYLKSVVDRHALRDRIHFDTRVHGARWDEARQLWVVESSQNGQKRVDEANVLVIAVGPNNRAKFPDVPNLDAFAGPVVHTAAWNDAVELDGRRVVQIGVGCSGVQLASAIAGRVGQLDIVMRQPEYILPNAQARASVDPLDRRAQEIIPFVAQWRRLQGMASSLQDMKGMMSIDPDWRAKTGRISQFNDAITDMSLNFLKSKFPDDPAMVRRLTPQYPLFAKRPILDCGYYDTLKLPNVNLIEGALASCEKDAVVLADGTRIPCDVLLLATGYHLDFCTQFDISGRDGKTLRDCFTPTPYAYEGQMVPGFPNLFITGGPNSYLVANHAVVSEQQVHWMMELLQAMVDENVASIDVRDAACEEYNQGIAASLELTCWVNKGSAHGYYRHASGKVVLAIGRHNSEIWHDTRVPKLEDFAMKPSDRPARVPANDPRKLSI